MCHAFWGHDHLFDLNSIFTLILNTFMLFIIVLYGLFWHDICSLLRFNYIVSLVLKSATATYIDSLQVLNLGDFTGKK